MSDIQWTSERPADGDMRPRRVQPADRAFAEYPHGLVERWIKKHPWSSSFWDDGEFEVLPPLDAPARPKKRIRIALAVDSEGDHRAKSIYEADDALAPARWVGPISRTFVIEVEEEVKP